MEKDKFGGQRLKEKFMRNYDECKNVEVGAAFWTKCAVTVNSQLWVKMKMVKHCFSILWPYVNKTIFFENNLKKNMHKLIRLIYQFIVSLLAVKTLISN